MSRCCKIQNFLAPAKRDLSMTLSPTESLSVSSVEEPSEIEPSIM